MRAIVAAGRADEAQVSSADKLEGKMTKYLTGALAAMRSGWAVLMQAMRWFELPTTEAVRYGGTSIATKDCGPLDSLSSSMDFALRPAQSSLARFLIIKFVLLRRLILLSMQLGISELAAGPSRTHGQRKSFF